jgi:hypothetical protein
MYEFFFFLKRIAGVHAHTDMTYIDLFPESSFADRPSPQVVVPVYTLISVP